MLTPELAIELTRIRIQQANERATLMSQLGSLPAPRPLFPFRRRVVSLPGTVELRPAVALVAAPHRVRHGDKKRIASRLREFSASERRAS